MLQPDPPAVDAQTKERNSPSDRRKDRCLLLQLKSEGLIQKLADPVMLLFQVVTP